MFGLLAGDPPLFDPASFNDARQILLPWRALLFSTSVKHVLAFIPSAFGVPQNEKGRPVSGTTLRDS